MSCHSNVDHARFAGDDMDAISCDSSLPLQKQVPPLRIAIDKANRNAPVGMTEFGETERRVAPCAGGAGPDYSGPFCSAQKPLPQQGDHKSDDANHHADGPRSIGVLRHISSP
jgi:hypothetical protein